MPPTPVNPTPAIPANAVLLEKGWIEGKDPNTNKNEWSIALHFQDNYNGERQFVSTSNDDLLVGVENDKPQGLPQWVDLIPVDYLITSNTSVNPAYGLIYIKALGVDKAPVNNWVVMSDVKHSGPVKFSRVTLMMNKASMKH